MLASGKASTNRLALSIRTVNSPLGREMGWHGASSRCVYFYCACGDSLVDLYIRGTGGPPVVGGLSTALSYGVYLNSLTTLVHRIAGSERSVEHQKHCIQLGHKGLVKEFGVPHVFRNLCEQHADQIPRAVR